MGFVQAAKENATTAGKGCQLGQLRAKRTSKFRMSGATSVRGRSGYV